MVMQSCQEKVYGFLILEEPQMQVRPSSRDSCRADQKLGGLIERLLMFSPSNVNPCSSPNDLAHLSSIHLVIHGIRSIEFLKRTLKPVLLSAQFKMKANFGFQVSLQKL
jgi:hypothetical protein